MDNKVEFAKYMLEAGILYAGLDWQPPIDEHIRQCIAQWDRWQADEKPKKYIDSGEWLPWDNMGYEDQQCK